MEKLFGADWRTTLSGWGAALTGFLTVVAALPYELGDVATLIPPDLKGKVAAAAAIATFILRLINSKVAKDAAGK